MRLHRLNGIVLAAILAVLALGAAAQAAIITHGTTTINMEFVTVGDPGNAPDDRGFGAVGYVYQIGKYEVTADQWAAVIAADPKVGNAGEWTGSQPTAGTSYYEAARFCNWLTTGSATSGFYWIYEDMAFPTDIGHDAYAAIHGTTYFIPTANEWHKAAYYDGRTGAYNAYPTGEGVPDGIDYKGDLAFDAVFNDGYNEDYPNSVFNAGVASPYGTIGQGGNVYEWDESPAGQLRGYRGESWNSDNPTHMARTYRGADGPWSQSWNGGFRVASIEAAPEPPDPNVIPEPSTFLIWSLLGTCVLGFVWHRQYSLRRAGR